jgi:hypothetical protein
MQTLCALNVYLPNSLAALASDYLCSQDADLETAATCGHYERAAAAMPFYIGTEQMERLMRCGHITIIAHIVRHAQFNSTALLVDACRSSMPEIAECVLDWHEPNMHLSLRAACENGHVNVARRTLDRGAKDVDSCLVLASQTGNIPLVTLLIERGARDYAAAADWAPSTRGGVLVTALHNRTNDISRVVTTRVLVHGHLFVRSMAVYTSSHKNSMGIMGPIYKDRSPTTPAINDWNWALQQACRGGNMKTVTFVAGAGAIDWQGGLVSACVGGHPRAVALMLDRGADAADPEALEAAIICGNVEVAELLIRRGANATSDHYAYMARVWGNRAMQRLVAGRNAR